MFYCGILSAPIAMITSLLMQKYQIIYFKNYEFFEIKLNV